MDHTKVTIRTGAEQAELLMSRLEELGITGFVIEDPADVRELLEKKNSYDWDYVDQEVLAREEKEPVLSFYVEDSVEGLELLEKALEEIRYLGFEDAELSPVREEDWRDKWKAYFKPAAVTERITVKPSWEPYEKRHEDELVVEIDPGMAFGTGLHPTTALSLELMEQYLVPGKNRVLDVGCGSGILTIAAALLGASETVGVELDPAALEVARKNLEHSGVKAELRQGDLVKGLEYKADLVVANLMADLVQLLAEDVGSCMEPGGVFISSGILVEKAPQVMESLKKEGFELLDIKEKEEWCAIAARLKP
ncbi:MAG: 50S ribosomal protein L11 methyltransferase [Bacillota bacterium]|nr:50S ribosomal protein L11 methyltransferase [Bacillota bacterium]